MTNNSKLSIPWISIKFNAGRFPVLLNVKQPSPSEKPISQDRNKLSGRAALGKRRLKCSLNKVKSKSTRFPTVIGIIFAVKKRCENNKGSPFVKAQFYIKIEEP